jgi:putative ABC transport system substrate-binding protein
VSHDPDEISRTIKKHCSKCGTWNEVTVHRGPTDGDWDEAHPYFCADCGHQRREFLTLLGGVAVGWPLAARAQQGHQVRRIGVLTPLAENDLDGRSRDAAFRERLNRLGWVDGRNVHIDYRWGADSADRMKQFAKELVRLKPDALVAITTPATAALHVETHTIPIVFAVVSDPIGSGFVETLSKPGGNITGFINIEASLSGKWLGLMHEIAPSVSRIACLFNPQTAPFARYYLDTFRSAASALAIEPIEAPVHSAAEIEAFLTKFSGEASVGLVVMPDTSTTVLRQTIISLTNRYRLPTIYPFAFFVADGGLISYGIDLVDSLRGAATYVDRILRGAKPDELPVQLPTKFELVINLKTARALGLTIPPALIATADYIIE